MYPHVHVLETVKSDNAMLTDRWGEYVRSNDEHIYLFLRLIRKKYTPIILLFLCGCTFYFLI